MAKGSRGGKRVTTGGVSGASVNPSANMNQNATPQVDNTQVAQAMGSDYLNFMAMSDDDKANFINNVTSQNVPAHLSDTDLQKFIYNSNMNDKPQLVDDSVLDTMNGTELFRTVNNVYDRQNDISYSADQIARQVQAGRITRTSDNGGSAYGRGIYFANDYTESSYYGNTRSNVQKTAVVRAKLNSNAKVISHNKALTGCSNEIRSGSKLGKALGKCDRQSQISIYALAKGYNVISANNGSGYFVILNRNAVTMSKSIKSMSSKW